MPTVPILTIRPAEELGPVLTGRTVAQTLRHRIEEAASASDSQVIVDLTGVAAASPSFADELFAKLPRHLLDSGRIRFENVPEPLHPLVRFVTRQRQQPTH